MSKRNDRREADRLARRAAYLLSRQPAAEPSDSPTTEPPAMFMAATATHTTTAADPQPTPAFDPKTLPHMQHFTEPPTATPAQINANRANAKLSTGAVTPEGKAIVSQNRRTHGLTGNFTILPWEFAADFHLLAESVYSEYQPDTATEQRLVDSLIQHYWLKERAVRLQEDLLGASENPTDVDTRKLGLFLRYQSTHERSYYKAQRELQNLQKETRKQQIGFESQTRTQQSHDARVRLTHAKARNLEIDTSCRQVMEVPLPGKERISFEELTKACSGAISDVVREQRLKAAA